MTKECEGIFFFFLPADHFMNNFLQFLCLRVRLFWVKMISGNHFPPNPHVWLQLKMKFSRNSFPVDQYLLL